MEWTAGRVAGVIIGAGGLWASLRAMQAMRAARAWPVVTGVVVARTTARVTAANLGARFAQHTPVVRYRYTVQGDTHECQTWFPAAVHNPPRGPHAWAARAAAAVPDLVRVHVNPAQPADAYLFPAPEWRIALAAGLSGVLLMAALLAAV